MSRSATVRSVRRAGRWIKRLMNFCPEGWNRLEDAGRVAVKKVLEAEMRQQLGAQMREAIGAGVPDRWNGTYPRRLLTEMGEIALSVPRTRRWSAAGMLAAYARRSPGVDRLILAAFIFGVSTRKVGEVLLRSIGVAVSATTVSRVARVLDAEVSSFHRRPLTNRYRALLFDGVVLRRRTGAGAQSRPVLVALGILPNGRKEVIDFLLAGSESQEAWEGFLNDLYRRGLTGEGLEVITIDGSGGLAAALQTVYPRIPVQRCWAHKVRNILEGIRVKDRPEAKRGLQRIYQAASRHQALRNVVRFGARWEETYPKAVRQLTRNLEELLVFFNFANRDWQRQIRTTNAIERRFREVRRRTRPMGVFSDRTSIERILYAVFSHENQNQGTATPFLVLTQTS